MPDDGPAAERRDSFSFAGNAAAAFTIQASGLLLAWIVQVALARTLSRTDFGIFTTVSALTATLSVPATLGLPVALVRLLPEYRTRSDWPHYRGLLRGSPALIGGTGMLLALATALAAWGLPLGAQSRDALLAGTVLIPALALSSLGMETLRGMGRVAQATWPPMLLQPGLMLAALAAAVRAGVRLDSRAGVLLLASSTLFALGIQFLLISRRSASDPGALTAPPAYALRRWLHLAFPLLLTAGFQMVLAQTDILVVSALLPPRQVAIYGVAAKLARFIGVTQFAVYLALGPSLVQAHMRGQHEAVQQAVSAAARWTFWPACAAALLLASGGRFLLSVYGPAFSPAYGPLCILGAGFLVNAGAGPVMVILNMTGHSYVVTKISGVSALGGVCLSLLLTARFGVWGAASASALAMAVWNVWMAVEVQRHLHVRAFVFRRRQHSRDTKQQ